MPGRLLSPIAAVAAVVAALVLAPVAAGETISVVASRIDNPRGLSLAADGTLYVASAGRAGPRCRGRGENRFCLGFSSGVLAIKDGAKRTAARGLLSGGGQDGSFATGVDGVSVGPDGRLLAVTTAGPPQQIRSLPPRVRRQAGRLFDLTGGQRRVVADISAVEWASNPDGVRGDRNSNPYAVLALADGAAIVVDAGGNDVLEVRDGRPRVLAVIPKNGRAQSVPTSIALGPDGAYYVGELAEGAGAGKARVWRVPADGGRPTVAASGFTGISGVAFGPDGSLFVTELTRSFRARIPRGDVVRVAPDGTRTRLGVGRLVAPAGAAVDPSGNVFVSNYSVLPARTPRNSPFRGAGGQVVRITP